MFARISSGRGVMTGLDNIATKLFIIRNIEFSLIVNKSTRSFGFERLECLSYRRLIIQAVLDALFKQWCKNFGRAKIKCCSSKSMKVFGRQYDLVIVVFSIKNLVA
jgi:hypothetical protein